MPIYVYRCSQGHQFDVFLKISDMDTPQYCKCGEKAERKIVPTMLNCDMQPWDSYISPASGKLITSYKERKEDMKATGCVDYEPSLKRDSKKNADRAEGELMAKIDDTVEREWDKMPSHKKERLTNELESGMDISVDRL